MRKDKSSREMEDPKNFFERMKIAITDRFDAEDSIPTSTRQWQRKKNER